jgi:tripartite-type tricarboxylate transporter receptor subunit TctC
MPVLMLMGRKMSRFLALIAAACLVLASAPTRAEDAAANYPNHTVKIIVCVPAGGGVDTVTRIIADKLSKKWGQPVVIENRAGASGNIGAATVYTADPDGYTLLASQPAPITINPLLYKKMSFDPTKFETVAIMSKIPNTLLVREKFPAKTAKEFLAYAKAHPGKLNYASQGNGTTSHLTAALMEKRTGIKAVHVPYKGTSPALNDLVAGHVDFIFMEMARSIALHRGGKARILAVATDKRLSILPDIPTMEEAGVPDFVSITWNAISAPPKTPAAIVAKINAAVNEALNEPDVQAHFKKVNLIPGGGSPAEAAAWVKQETKNWGQVIKDAGVKPR